VYFIFDSLVNVCPEIVYHHRTANSVAAQNHQWHIFYQSFAAPFLMPGQTDNLFNRSFNGEDLMACSPRKKRVLFVCTGNSCRSQMADGIINHDFHESVEAFSAGTEQHGLNPKAVRVMAEIGIDIGSNSSDHLDKYADQSFDYVISLCGDADEKCPAFFGGVKRLHMPFDDPPRVQGTEEVVMAAYRLVRDEIRTAMHKYFNNELGD
jgi:arsenate reductase